MQSSSVEQEGPRISKKATRASDFSSGPRKKQVNMSTDDYDESFQRQALEVPQLSENFDLSAEPQSGEEFLMKMLHERKRCPAVVVKRPKNWKPPKHQSSAEECYGEPLYIKKKQDDTFPSSLRPSPEWKCVQESSFLTVRDQVNYLRSELKAQKYNNELEPPFTSDVSEWKKFCREHSPLLSIILRISQRSLEQLLDMLSTWLREGADPPTAPEVSPAPGESETIMEQDQKEEADEVPVASSSAAADAVAKSTKPDAASVSFDLSTGDQWLGSWMYATLACLHLPLEPTVHSTLRDIARVCVRLRNRLSSEETEKALPYNLLICLISKVFDQLDFEQFV